MYRSSSDTGFYNICSAVRALRVYLRPRFSLHRTENDNITLRPLKFRYHSDMEFSVRNSFSAAVLVFSVDWYFRVSISRKYPLLASGSMDRSIVRAFLIRTWPAFTHFRSVVQYTAAASKLNRPFQNNCVERLQNTF